MGGILSQPLSYLTKQGRGKPHPYIILLGKEHSDVQYVQALVSAIYTGTSGCFRKVPRGESRACLFLSGEALQAVKPCQEQKQTQNPQRQVEKTALGGSLAVNHPGTLVPRRRTPRSPGRGVGVLSCISLHSEPTLLPKPVPSLWKGVQVSPRKLCLHSAAASPRPCSPGTSAALDSLAGE